jgi:hypothetical protein
VKPLSALGLLAVGLVACDADTAASSTRDAGPTGGHGGGGSGGGVATACTAGPANLTLGVDHPFVPVEITAEAPPVFDILTGGQGAFHIEISLRADGPFDPDSADLEIALTRGDWQLSEFVGRNLLLSLLGGVCSYDKIRLVLTDETGGILGEDRLGELRGQTVHLVAKLTSNGTTATWDGALSISHRTLDDGNEDAGTGDTDALPVFAADAGSN